MTFSVVAPAADNVICAVNARVCLKQLNFLLWFLVWRKSTHFRERYWTR